MEVILLERVARLGQMGEVVRVKDGFARTFLLPRGKALRATNENRTRFEAMKSDLQARSQSLKTDANEIAEKLDGKSFIVLRQASESGQLFGSVSPRDLVGLLAEGGFEVNRSQVALNAPIKMIGRHKVPISLHPEIDTTISIIVARNADEAARIERGEDVAQVGHVCERVMHLLVCQWPARPVGEAVGLVRPVTGDALDQLVVGDRVAVAERHGGDLRIEDRVRHDPGTVPDNLDILARGVKDLEHLFVSHQREEGLEVDAFRERIDHRGFFRARHLHHAQQRVIGGLAKEFSVDGDDPMFGEAITKGGEFRSSGNQIHERSMTLSRRAFGRKR